MGYFRLEKEGEFPQELYQRDGETRAQAIERNEKGAAEHFATFDAMAHRIGIQKIARIVPATKAEILTALQSGDQHLNTIPLARWDGAAGGFRPYPGHPLYVTAEGSKYILSLSDRVCVLKHVARHYVIKEGA